ncbi:MAG: sugar kinase [Clostridia bacterium]|nr:sugar kinase [Clostridia bacterium]
MKTVQGVSKERLNQLLEGMANTKAVLVGDMCLDIYWVGDMTRSHLSRETPHFPLPVVEERMSAGAGANAAVNMATLCPSAVAIGVIGNDWRGACLKDVLRSKNMNTDGIVTAEGFTTNAYCKPMRRGYLGFEIEDPRLDFENYVKLTPDIEDKLIENLKKYATDADVICVSDQFEYGCITDRVRECINALAESGRTVVVDSRTRINLYKNCILKPNEIECARATNSAPLDKDASEEDILSAASKLGGMTSSGVCLTLGDRGCLIYRDGRAYRISAIKVEPPVDTCGAGDCFLPAFALALSAGACESEAGVIGAMASAICVKKINTTGSASRDELLAIFDKNGREE